MEYWAALACELFRDSSIIQSIARLTLAEVVVGVQAEAALLWRAPTRCDEEHMAEALVGVEEHVENVMRRPTVFVSESE